jgi:hypothetical protein
MGLSILMMLAAQLSVAGKPLAARDFLDGRAIAGGTGTPVVLLTLTPEALARISKLGPLPKILLNGKPATARLNENMIELDGQPSFEAAAALARALSGKPPLPDSLEE